MQLKRFSCEGRKPIAALVVKYKNFCDFSFLKRNCAPAYRQAGLREITIWQWANLKMCKFAFLKTLNFEQK
jgi:hypothetical protein